MHPTIMTEQRPIEAFSHQPTSAVGRRRSSKHRTSNSRENPYLPSNPCRRSSVALVDPYASKQQQQQQQQQRSKRFQDSKPSSRARSDSTTKTTVLHSSSTSLDDIAPSHTRVSRWESNSAESKSTAAMAMPTRRRGESPSPNDTVVAPNSRRATLAAASTQGLKELRRKLSGDLSSSSSTATTATTSSTTTTLTTAMRQSRLTKKPQRPTASPPAAASTTSRATAGVLFSPLADLNHSDSDDEHVFMRRSDSNKALFFYQRDDSQNDLYHHRGVTTAKDRAASIGPLRIPKAFINNNNNNNKTTTTTSSNSRNHHDSKTKSRQRPATSPSLGMLHKLQLSNDDDDDDDDDECEEDLDDLVRALDKQSEDHGHIFLSKRNLLAFAAESDED